MAIMVTVPVAYFQIEAWRGKRAWDAYIADLKAKGTWTDLDSLRPASVSDEQNFAMAPILQPFFLDPKDPDYWKKTDWLKLPDQPRNDIQSPANAFSGITDIQAWQKYLGTDDVLSEVNKLAPQLDAFRAASQRPSAVYPTWLNTDGFISTNLAKLLNLGQVMTLRVNAELAAGQNENAAQDLVANLRFGRLLAGGPTLTSALIGIAIIGEGTESLRMGLERSQWTDAQLHEIQDELRRADFIAWQRRGFIIAEWRMPSLTKKPLASIRWDEKDTLTSKIITFLDLQIPKGWWYQNLLVHDRYFQSLLPAFQPEAHYFDAEIARQAWDQWLQAYPASSPYTYWGKYTTVNLSSLALEGAIDQIQTDQTLAACALERYRLANGKFPEKLDALIPQFLAKVPTEVFIKGQPMQYERLGDNQYRLLSTSVDKAGKTSPVVWNLTVSPGAAR